MGHQSVNAPGETAREDRGAGLLCPEKLAEIMGPMMREGLALSRETSEYSSPVQHNQTHFPTHKTHENNTKHHTNRPRALMHA
eukprot:COSAG05_NODE_2586_length_2871_cov_21.775758_6_plen_83_part_00